MQSFNDYQRWALTTAIYPESIRGLYPLMGLVGETGELAEKALDLLKLTANNPNREVGDKLLRTFEILREVAHLGKELEALKKDFRKNGTPGYEIVIAGEISDREELKKETGDQMWYQAAFCSDFLFGMAEIAQLNHDKLESRKARNVLEGSGDNR